METFMNRRIRKVNEYLFELVDECICDKEDILEFKDFTIGVLYSPIADNLISVKYFIIGFPERYKLMDYLDDGTITDIGLRYIENLFPDDVVGGIDFA